MNQRIVLLCLSVVLLGISGCNPVRTIRNLGGTCHDPKPYQKASSIAPLKIPPGLDTPDTASALHVPTLNEPPPPARKGRDPCLDEPPSFVVPKKAAPQA